MLELNNYFLNVVCFLILCVLSSCSQRVSVNKNEAIIKEQKEVMSNSTSNSPSNSSSKRVRAETKTTNTSFADDKTTLSPLPQGKGIQLKTTANPVKKKVISNQIKIPIPKIKAKPKKSNPDLFTIKGTLTLDLQHVKDKNVNLSDAVVYFVPKNKGGLITKNNTYTITTQNKRFKPNVLVVPVGSTVIFPNQDRILHNVFSVSENAQFDLGLYAAGNQKEVVFKKAGIVYVHCNVHHSMQADILVIDTPYYALVDNNGNFDLKGLNSLDGKLYVWHPRAALKQIENYSNTNALNISLSITRDKIPLHLNKFGSPYTKNRK